MHARALAPDLELRSYRRRVARHRAVRRLHEGLREGGRVRLQRPGPPAAAEGRAELLRVRGGGEGRGEELERRRERRRAAVRGPVGGESGGTLVRKLLKVLWSVLAMFRWCSMVLRYI